MGRGCGSASDAWPGSPPLPLAGDDSPQLSAAATSLVASCINPKAVLVSTERNLNKVTASPSIASSRFRLPPIRP